MEDKCEDCSGSGHKQVKKKLKITIPAGVDSGTRLRVSGEGDAGQRGGPAGDLYVYLFVNEDPDFQREGINLLSEVQISYLQAILGCQIAIPTVDGDEQIVVPAGTQPGTVVTLEGKGVPRLGNPVSRGDLLVTVQVEVPQRVSPEERKLLEELATIRGEQVGKNKEGLFGGIFGGHRS